MKRLSLFLVRVLLALDILGMVLFLGRPVAAGAAGYEVWAIDQADTAADGGGTLYIYRGGALEGPSAATATPEVIDLGGAARALCLAQTGSAPVRPHMLSFNAARSHAVLAFVASGHVLFLEAATRAPVGCVDVGTQAHAAIPAPDQTYVVVANQNGKLLQRIATRYASNSYALDEAATLNLAMCTTPNNAFCQDPQLRPDTAPVCPVIDASGRFTFVTLRGGGLFVLDATANPMAILAEYDRATVNPNGCGGVEADGAIYINAGGGTAANPHESDLYAFPVRGFSASPNPPNTPAPTLIFSQDDRGVADSHGAVLAAPGLLWVADRAANRIVVADTRSGTVANEIVLAGTVSDDPAPDLLDRAPNGGWIFVTLRGPSPLTGNEPSVNNAVGSTPGLGVIRVEQGGRGGTLLAVARITRVVNGAERADPHGLAVRQLPPGMPATGAGGGQPHRPPIGWLAILIGGGLVAIGRAVRRRATGRAAR